MFKFINIKSDWRMWPGVLLMGLIAQNFLFEQAYYLVICAAISL